MSTKRTTTVDITPSWLGLLPGLLAVVVGHEKTPAGLAADRTVREELRKMAGLADAHVSTIRNGVAIERELKAIATALEAGTPSVAIGKLATRIRAVAERV